MWGIVKPKPPERPFYRPHFFRIKLLWIPIYQKCVNINTQFNYIVNNNKIKVKDIDYPASYKIVQYLKDCDIGKVTRNNKLSNSRIRQITYTLYMFNEIVTSNGIKQNVNKELNKLFFDRIILHKEYYNNNELLKSVYSYFKNIIEKNYVNIDK